MDSEEDEASTVNEPAFEVGVGESAVAGAGEDAKCEPEPERFGVLSESEPPPREFLRIAGGDPAEEAKKEGSEGNGVENGATEKDLDDGAREEEKDEVCVGEVSAAAEEEEKVDVSGETAVEKVDVADEGDRSVKAVEMVSENADLADVAAEKSAIVSEKDDLAGAQAEESGIVSVEGGLADAAAAKTVAYGLDSLAGEERGLGLEEGDEAEAAAEEEDGNGSAEEFDTANVVRGVEVEGAMDSEAVEEGDFGGNVEETETGMEEEERDPEEEEETDAEAEAKGDEYGGAADETMEAEAEDEAGEAEGDAVDEMEETEAADEAEGMEVTEEQELGRGKRKRGRNQKALARAPLRKKTEEDVCFICFDGGELVLCDRRSVCVFKALFCCGVCDKRSINLYDCLPE